MLGLMRDLFMGLILLGLLAAIPWLAEQVVPQNSETDFSETAIVLREPYYDLAVSRQDGRFAAVGMHGQVTVGQMDDPAAEIQLDLPERHVTSLQFSPRELCLLLGCEDGEVLWQPLDVLEPQDVLEPLDVLKRQDMLKPQDVPHSLAKFDSSISAISVSADGRLAAMACCPFENEPTHISIVEIHSAVKRAQSIADHMIVWMSFTADGRELLCRDSLGSVLMIDSMTGTLLGKVDLPGMGTGPATLSPTSRLLAIGGVNGQVAMIDLGQRRVVSQWSVSSTPISSLEYLRLGGMLACGTSNQLMLLNGHDHKVVAEQPTGVQQIQFTSNGEKMITSGHDGTIRRWSLPDLVEEQCLVSEPL